MEMPIPKEQTAQVYMGTKYTLGMKCCMPVIPAPKVRVRGSGT